MITMSVLTWQKSILLLMLLTSCSGQTIYYVTPTPDTLCPGEPCHTLSEYVADQHFQNFMVNTTMEFLPGNHSLEQTISMTNLTWLTLHGDSSSLPEVTSRIVCTWPAGFVFTNITELHISALGFLSCGHNDSAAVTMISVQQSDISNCIFQNSTNKNQDGSALCYNSFTVKKIHNDINFAATGGALYIDTSNLTIQGNYFRNNSAVCGGALGVWKGNLVITGNTFRDNSANNIVAIDDYSIDEGVGGVLSTFYSNLTLVGNTFQNNSVDAYSGIAGVLFVWLSHITLTGNLLHSNSAYQGGTLIALKSTLTLTGNTFVSNSALGSGGALDLEGCIGNLKNNTFQNHSSLFGGAVCISNSSLNLTGNTFQLNSASQGGALMAVLNSSLDFTSNLFTGCSAELLGGAILAVGNSIARMHGKNIIQTNTAQYGGGIATLDSHLDLIDNTIFQENTASYGGGLYAHSTRISGKATISSNSATEGGGGVYAARSVFHFKGNLTIMNNSAVNGNGGGLLFSGESKFYLQPDTHMYFISNGAKSSGGGIKIEELNPLSNCIYNALSFDVSSSDCFFQLQNQTEKWNNKTASGIKAVIEELDVGIYFHNNSAVEAGADLHGGSIDNCTLNNIKTNFCYLCPTSGEVFDDIVSSENKLDISSAPLHICTCRDNLTDCSGSYFPEPVYPGGTLEVPVTARGQRNGTTAAVIQVANALSIFQGSENTQNINNYCTTIRYTVHSISSQETTLYAEGPCPPTNMNTLKVVISILQCPPGFHLSYFQPICICAERLQKFTNTCLIDHKTVLRAQNAEFWVGYDGKSQDLILHPHCPFDYCTLEKVYLSVDDSDKQCNYNRSGLLCGRCSENLSLALGSSHCLQCSNSHLALLPAFLFAGIALVLLLLVLRLTVAAGTINGLIFYANIVEVNSAVFFQPKVTNVLTVFIAWLNLDLGIETCFYNGLDAYVKTWLQFMFPLYVWALVGLIILGSHFSGRIARMFGSNPIAVLATLFLLSYAKLLRTAFAAVSYTILEYVNHEQIVWLYDGNISYLSRKHTPLFTAAVFCLVFLFLPYTMLLIFSQWLQASKSRYKIFSWVNSPKIKPFLDAYHAPFTNKHRYWTGVMFLFRFVLFMISAFPFNALSDPSVNLLAIAYATTALLTILAILGNKVYKDWYLSLLEISFLLNLTILAATTLFLRLSNGKGNQNAATFTSVGIAFAIFAGIVFYHALQQMKGTWLYKRVHLNFGYIPVPDTNQCGFSVPEDPPDVVYVSGSAPTQTVVDVHISELREPCMATN